MLDLSQPDQFPSGLTEIYQNFFERRFTDAWSDEGSFKTKVRPLLELVLASPEPLPIAIAKDILKWGPYDGPAVLKSLGSLLKRAKGGLAGEDEETLAPFHNSVREWLQDAVAAGDFYVSAEDARYPLTEVVWKRYLDSNEKDAYGWDVLPVLLPGLANERQDELLGPPSWDTSKVLYRLADSLAPKQRFTEAAEVWKAQVRSTERLTTSAPGNAEFDRMLSVGCHMLGDIEQALGNSQGAITLYQRGLGISERLSCNDPENTMFASDLALSYNRLGRALGFSPSALTYHRQALEISARLFRSAPDNSELASNLSGSYDCVGDVEQALGNIDEAQASYQQGLRIREQLAHSVPENAKFARSLSISYERLGDMQRARSNAQAALALYQQGLVIRARLANRFPENAVFARDLSVSYRKLGIAQHALKNSQEALVLYQQGMLIAKRLFGGAPENAQYASDLSISYNGLGDLQQAIGNGHEALSWYQQGLEILERLAASAPDNATYSLDVAKLYGRMGGVCEEIGRTDDALSYYQRNLSLASDLAAKAPKSVDFARNLSISFERLGVLMGSLGRSDSALDCCQKSVKIRETLVANFPDSAVLARDLWNGYWNHASIADGTLQVQLLLKVQTTLLLMQARGTFTKNEEHYLALVNTALGTV
jgi:tetratricopeptide (TPR) repeat protein